MKIRNPWLMKGCAWLLSFVLRGLFFTVRTKNIVRQSGTDPFENVSSDRFLYCIWHDSAIGVIFSKPWQAMAGLVSQHADGSILSLAMKYMRILPVRGSTNHGGAAAIRTMLDVLQTHDIAIATDGPRGPRRRIKEGIIYVASHTGRPIVPVIYVAESVWRIKGRWTDMTIPRPFSRAVLIGGAPFHVPPNLDRSQITALCEQLQQQLDGLHAALEHHPADAPALAERLRQYYDHSHTPALPVQAQLTNRAA